MHIKMSEAIDKLAPALVKAVNEIKGVAKDNVADAGKKKYHYADLTSCIEEAKRALGLHNLTVLQPPAMLVQSPSTEGGAGPPTPMIATIIMHESGQWIAGEMFIPDLDYPHVSPAQGIGSTITYMRRYSLCSMLSIPMEDDDGASGAKRPAQPQRYEQRHEQRYDQRDDRLPTYNGNGRSEPARHAPSRPAPSAADRLADSVPRQPAARPAPRPPVNRDDIPVDDSFGEPPPHVRSR